MNSSDGWLYEFEERGTADDDVARLATHFQESLRWAPRAVSANLGTPASKKKRSFTKHFKLFPVQDVFI